LEFPWLGFCRAFPLCEPRQALDELTNAAELASQLDGLALEAGALDASARLAYEIGDMRRAVGCFGRELRLRRVNGEDNMTLESNLACARAMAGEVDSAFESYDDLIVRSRETDNRYAEALNLNNCGIALDLRGRRDEARNCYLSAWRLQHRLGAAETWRESSQTSAPKKSRGELASRFASFARPSDSQAA
jgi:tetratricopeptide (TPR) repeat protein